MKALVVDDSRAIRSIIARHMKELGFLIEEAENGRQALQTLVDSGPFQIALVDWNMPVMNGLEFVYAVRNDRGLDEMAIMMITSENELSQVRRAIDAGANEYLMKPFSTEAIDDKLRILGIEPQ